MSTAVEFQNVSFSYGGKSVFQGLALDGVDLAVEEGEFLAVLGHNGSGKSTLARVADGLLTVKSGSVKIFGRELKEEGAFEIRKQIGMVFQNPDNQTVASIVEDDIAFGPENVGIEREEIGRRIDFALSAVGMEEYRHSMTVRLSGGQKQRIAIAGVLALKPKIMILDEVTAMLDPKGRKEIVGIVKRLNKEEGITVIMITHFPEEAILADRAVVMNRGKIVMEGKPSEIMKRGDELESFCLTLPHAIKFCHALSLGGLFVPDVLEANELAEEIVSRLKDYSALSRRNTETDFFASESETNERKTEGEEIVTAKNLRYVYDPSSPFETAALCDVDVEIREGEIFGIIGKTGSGKSTFVQHLNALLKVPIAEKKCRLKRKEREKYSSVRLVVNGFDLCDKHTDFKALRKKVGVVFQYPEQQLFAETVFEDVAFGFVNFLGREPTKRETEEAVRTALERVGLDYSEVKDRSPFELSGGQRRRVAIAGVLVSKPEILVLDEPAAGLDPLGKQQIDSLIRSLRGTVCKTVVIVSHDMDEIAESCDRAVVFSEGKTEILAPISELFHEAEKLYALDLDVPFTAKVLDALKAKGISIDSDYTLKNTVRAILDYAEREGKRNA